MKRLELIKKLKSSGCFFHRHWKNHYIYINPLSKKKAPVQRHKELQNTLCELIFKQLDIN